MEWNLPGCTRGMRSWLNFRLKVSGVRWSPDEGAGLSSNSGSRTGFATSMVRRAQLFERISGDARMERSVPDEMANQKADAARGQ